jgi:hypothetical protein
MVEGESIRGDKIATNMTLATVAPIHILTIHLLDPRSPSESCPITMALLISLVGILPRPASILFLLTF